MRYWFSYFNTKRVDYFKTCVFINVNVNGVWYWCEFSQWLSCPRWACITWQMCPPWPALRSETPRSGHQGRVTTAQYWPVLPNTRQFLTISKVILFFTVAHWPQQQEAPSPSWRKVISSGNKLELDWDGHIRNAWRVLPSDWHSHPRLLNMRCRCPSQYWMWCSLQRGARLSSVIIFKYFKSSHG